MCTIHDNQIMYDFWDIECDRQIFFSFWTIFCLFDLLTTQNIKILKKIKKTPGNIIILQMCTLNDNHMMYGFWDMEGCDRQNFFSFWAVFFPFYPSNNSKYQNFEKMKKHSGDITILHMCTLDMRSDGQNFLSFWTVFAYLSP